MTSSRKNRVPFSGFEASDFADWLWLGMLRFHTTPASNRGKSFKWITGVIGRHETLSDDLAYVYRTMVPADRQLHFRRAVGNVLRDRDRDSRMSERIASDLIYLLAKIRATESLDAIVTTIGSGEIGRRMPDLQYEAMAALRHLSPGARVYEVTHSLTTARNFDDGYLFESLDTMLESNPEKVLQTLSDLLPKLTRLRARILATDPNEFSEFQGRLSETRQVYSRYVPASQKRIVIEALNPAPEHTWLLEALYADDKTGPTVVRDDSTPGEFCIRDNAVKLPIEMNLPAYWVLRRLNSIRSSRIALLVECEASSKGAVRGQGADRPRLSPAIGAALLRKRRLIAPEVPPDSGIHSFPLDSHPAI